MKDTADVITPELLLHGYAIGIFPMAEERDASEIFWVDPKRRGVLPLEGFHVSRSTAKRMGRSHVRATLNQCFSTVVEQCAAREDTWINAEIQSLYNDLHGAGKAHSLEIWYGDTLAGGVYGVALGGAFFGESMFSAQTNGSKIALAVLTTHLKDQAFTLFDTQFVTPHLRSLGAIEISRATYLQRLDHALSQKASIQAPLPSPQDVVQRKTQTS